MNDHKLQVIAPKSEKQLCVVCGFMVVADGHEQRCRVPGVSLRIETDVEEKAWIGDAKLLCDVRLVAIARRQPGARDAFVQDAVSNAALAAYMMPGQSLSKSRIKYYATCFEASYLDTDFRIKYLVDTFGITVFDEIQNSTMKLSG